MAGHFARRLPLQPLIDELHLQTGWSNGQTPGWAVILARLAGVTSRTVQRWVQDGGVPELHADRIAIAAGLHPAFIWPDWYRDDEQAAA